MACWDFKFFKDQNVGFSNQFSPNSITPTLRQSPRQVRDKVATFMICVHDFPRREVLVKSA